MMDRKNWPWRKKNSNHHPNIITSPNTALHHAALDVSQLNSGSASPATIASPSFEARDDRPTVPSMVEKKNPLLLLEDAKALEEALALKEQAEQKVKVLTENLEAAERDLASKESMVKQHSKVAEEAIAGWEKAEAEAVSSKQELGASIQQRILTEGRVVELDEALKGCMKQLKEAQEEQKQRTQEAIDKKMQEWSKVQAEMERVEEDLKQRILAAEAQGCAMAKSLEERAKAIVEWQEGKEKAEMEVGLLQVKLESQSMEMTALRYELRVLSKELEIRNQEVECSRKASDSAHKQHLENVKKMTNLDSECQRLRMLVRKRLPGPAALLQMKMELEKSEGSKRRRSLGASDGAISSFQQGSNVTDNVAICKDMADRLLAMEEQTRILKDNLAKKTAELHRARQICARTATKLSVAEEQLDSLQGTPTSARSTQTSALENFLRQSQALNGVNSERLDDEVSCAESWASALITELDQFKKSKQPTDALCVNSMPEHRHETPTKPLINSSAISKPASSSVSSPNAQDHTTLKMLASKDAQLQSANLMCKDAMAALALAEVKLGGTWMSENPKSNVEESISSVGEAHGIMSKLDRILDDMRIAVASVGDGSDDDNSGNGALSSLVHGLPSCTVAVDASTELVSLKEKIDIQAKEISEMQMQVGKSEEAKGELQKKLLATEEELNGIKPELETALMQIEELKSTALNSQSEQCKLVVDEEAKRRSVEAELEAERSKVSGLQSSITSLTAEIAEQRKEHEAVVATCEALDVKLQSYVRREHHIAASCRFEDKSNERARKEREVAAAKEKLQECQRTIFVLGKQLTAFTSPSSVSFDSTVHFGTLDPKPDIEVDHMHKVHARTCQRRSLPYSSVAPHEGVLPPPIQNAHVPDIAKTVQINASQYSKPRRIHSDLSHRTGPTNHVQYSVAEHLQMDDGVSSFYDSLPKSVASSPSSQYTSPSDKFRVQRDMNGDGRRGGARLDLGKSLERAAAAQAVAKDKKRDGRSDHEKKMGHGVETAGLKNGGFVGGGGGGGGGKASKSFSRFFGRSKKS